MAASLLLRASPGALNGWNGSRSSSPGSRSSSRRFFRPSLSCAGGGSAALPPKDPPTTSPGDEAKRLHAETALAELRHMREALAPAAHNRVERRRSPPPGTGPKIERRKKGARRVL